VRVNFLCALALALCLIAIPAYASEIPEGFSLCAENESLRLYANAENLAVVIEDKATGSLLHSVATEEGAEGANSTWKGFMRSAFAVEYFNNRSPMPERVDAYNGFPTISFSNAPNGFDAIISYEKTGITLTLQVRLASDGVTAQIPADSIREGEGIRISAVYLYPFMGASKPGDTDGYMLIPEGAGAIISLQDNRGKYKAPYRKRIYGANIGIDKESTSPGAGGRSLLAEPVEASVPVYGIARESEGLAFLAIAEAGQYNAEILSYPNGVVTPYNWTAFRFIFREQYTMHTTRSQGILTSESDPYLRDIGVRFAVLTGQSANYSGMAQAYKSYLKGKGQLPQKSAEYRTIVDFLGAETKKGAIFDTVVKMTSASQMGDILQELLDNNVGAMHSSWKGWQSGGLSGSYGSGSAKVESSLGGNAGAKNLLSRFSPNDVIVSLQQDFLLANTKRLYNTSSDIAKTVSQTLALKSTNAQPFDSLYYFTPSKIKKQVSKFASAWPAAPISIPSLADTLFSFYSNGSVHSRGETAEALASAISVIKDSSPQVFLGQPFDYMWPLADCYLDMPMYTSNYSYIAAEVPFLPMVLKGSLPYYAPYANFEPNREEFCLRMIEYGALPSFLLTAESPEGLRDTNSDYVCSSQLEVFLPAIVEYSGIFRELSEAVGSSEMSSHEILASGVSRTSYASGVSVLVNRSGQSYGDLDAMSYKITR
jgi:hypothetical protein